MLPPPRRVDCMEAGVTPGIWVVNNPVHVLELPEASRATPLTESESAVALRVGNKMNGDPATIEHPGRFGSSTAAQTVLFKPGPSTVKSKCRLGLPTKVMKLRTVPPPTVRS